MLTKLNRAFNQNLNLTLITENFKQLQAGIDMVKGSKSRKS